MATTREPEEAPPEAQRLERLRILDLSAVGLAFPVALLLGYFAGRAIGGWLGSAQLGGLIGALFGIVGGFYNLFKMVSRLAPRSTPSDGQGAQAGAAAAAEAAGRSRRGPEAVEAAGPYPLDDDPADLDPLDDEGDDLAEDR